MTSNSMPASKNFLDNVYKYFRWPMLVMFGLTTICAALILFMLIGLIIKVVLWPLDAQINAWVEESVFLQEIAGAITTLFSVSWTTMLLLMTPNIAPLTIGIIFRKQLFVRCWDGPIYILGCVSTIFSYLLWCLFIRALEINPFLH